MLSILAPVSKYFDFYLPILNRDLCQHSAQTWTKTLSSGVIAQ